MKDIVFAPTALAQLEEWIITNPKIARKIYHLVESIKQDAFNGIGKPEALKHNLSGYWARRITKEHRLVYRVNGQEIMIASCKGHYL
jgi:toxin YoeB